MSYNEDNLELEQEIQQKLEHKLEPWLQKNTREFDHDVISQAVSFLEALWKQNEYLNLTAAKNLEELIEKHFLDALALLDYVKIITGNIGDLGTGGGFPGIPLKLFLPEVECYLIDASRKKINFLKYTAEQINLKQIYFLNDRAENLARKSLYREQFDYITVRAVAELSVLLELGLPLIKQGGSMFVYKGPRSKEELKKAENALYLCRGKLHGKWYYTLPSGEARSILEIKKTAPISDKYPRKPGKPEKNPL